MSLPTHPHAPPPHVQYGYPQYHPHPPPHGPHPHAPQYAHFSTAHALPPMTGHFPAHPQHPHLGQGSYAPPPQSGGGTVAPSDTTFVHTYQHMHAPPHAPGATNGTTPQGGVAQSPAGPGGGAPEGSPEERQRDLQELARDTTLKSRTLALDMHAAVVVSLQTTLDVKSEDLKEITERKAALEQERQRLINSLRDVNEERDKVDLMETTISKECTELQAKIKTISEGEFANAKREVDALRAELGESPTPSLQQLVEEKSAAYLIERRQNVEALKRAASAAPATNPDGTPVKRPRGRPKGSKSKPKPPKTGDAGGGPPTTA